MIHHQRFSASCILSAASAKEADGWAEGAGGCVEIGGWWDEDTDDHVNGDDGGDGDDDDDDDDDVHDVHDDDVHDDDDDVHDDDIEH